MRTKKRTRRPRVLKVKIPIFNIEYYHYIEPQKDSDDLDKRIKVANIFFHKSLKLIFVLSGIIGISWIFIGKSREDRERRDRIENMKMRDWEIIKLLAKNEKILSKLMGKN